MKKRKTKQKTEWTKLVSRPLTIFKAEPLIEKWVELGVDTLAIPVNKGENCLYVDKRDFDKFGKKIVEKVKYERNYKNKHKKECYETCESFVKVCKKIGKSNIRKKSNKELYKLFLQYYKEYMNYSFLLLVPISIEQSLFESVREEVGKILKRRRKINLLQKYLDVFSMEVKMIEAKKEEISLLEIKIELERNNNKMSQIINERIDKHIKKYCWIPVYDVTHKLWDKNDFLKRLKKIRNPKEKLKKIKEEFKNRKVETEKSIIELKPDKKLLAVIEFLQEYIFLRTYRTDALRKTMYYIQPLVEEIARRAKITKEEAAYITKEELERFLLENILPDKKMLKERARHCLILRRKNSYKIYSNIKEIEEIIDQELEKEDYEVKILKGNIAYSGVVKGKVKIIKSIKEIGKLKKGEILVASMTTPDMIIVIRHASAIITDEGGITCHAAIVSRELKKPCIVGTKIATKVLKDGDLVEVDADKGVVEIINRQGI